MKRTIVMLFALFLILALGQSAQAIPSLQLDIAGGYYGPDETIYSSGTDFTLYAYLLPDATTPLDDWYYISAAVTPKVSSPDTLGSFSVNGNPINVTSGMVYGTPPIETFETQLFENGDLAKHDIFNTYFIQFAFQFDLNNKATAYNTQDYAGSGPTPNANGTMYYHAFTIDTSALDPGYFIHFDLYNSLTTPTRVCTGQGQNRICTTVSDIDINSFAPFSHDAQSNGHQVPEPSSLWLMGMGLLGLGFLGRKNRKTL
ncbi:MAG: choice-of-anchor N protein [Nitrospirae bacterium]|nr:choice-of-anchor N protein [Nitrospirota bacterium]